MVGYVNTELMCLCPVNDEEQSSVIADYLISIIISQAGHRASGAQSLVEKNYQDDW